MLLLQYLIESERMGEEEVKSADADEWFKNLLLIVDPERYDRAFGSERSGGHSVWMSDPDTGEPVQVELVTDDEVMEVQPMSALEEMAMLEDLRVAGVLS